MPRLRAMHKVVLFVWITSCFSNAFSPISSRTARSCRESLVVLRELDGKLGDKAPDEDLWLQRISKQAADSGYEESEALRARIKRWIAKNDIVPIVDPAASTVDDDPKARWLAWLRLGKPRGAEVIKMREPLELGGVPRSDRYSSRDWLHNTANLPNSAILRAIRYPVMFMTAWAALLSVLYNRLLASHPNLAAALSIPPNIHSLSMSALGLLLVFRTNSAYQRFAEGRKIWGDICNSSRDLYRYIMMYEKEIGIEKRRRIQRLVAAFPYLLRHRVRPNLVMHRLDDEAQTRDPENSILLYQDRADYDNDPVAAAVANEAANTGKSRRTTRPLYWVDKQTLPWKLMPLNALQECARAQNRPLWVVDRIAMEVRTVPDGPNFTARERLALVSHVDKLSRLIGDCERIHQTAVPLNYARHSLRALTLWLFSLPLALVKEFGFWTSPATFLVSWLLFGVYEIGYAIEDPFQGTLRLSIICDSIRRDVLGDEVIRATAFSRSLSSSDDDDDDDDDDDVEGDDDDGLDRDNKGSKNHATLEKNGKSVPMRNWNPKKFFEVTLFALAPLFLVLPPVLSAHSE